MDKKLPETTYLCVEIMNSKRQKGETWSRGTNKRFLALWTIIGF